MDSSTETARIVGARRALADGRVVHVRVGRGGDAAGVLEVREATVRESIYTIVQADELELDEGRQRASIEQSATESGWLFLVAECDGRIVGYLEFANGAKRRTRHAGMFSIYLLDGWRGLGIGSDMVRTLVEWAEATDAIEKITLAVFATNERARALYQRHGFAVEGYCPRDMKCEDGTYIDSVLMYRFVDGRQTSDTNSEYQIPNNQ